MYHWLRVHCYCPFDQNAEVCDPLIHHGNGLFLKAVDHRDGLCVYTRYDIIVILHNSRVLNWDWLTIPLTSQKFLKNSFFPILVSPISSKSSTSHWRNPEGVIPLSIGNKYSGLIILRNYSGTSYLPVRVLQSLSLIPFELSHLKKSSTDMELLNVRLFVAEGSSGGSLRWPTKINVEMKYL